MRVRDQAFLNRGHRHFDRQVPGINDQPVDLYHPGQGSGGELAGQHPFVVELVHVQKCSDLFRFVGSGAFGDAEVTAQISRRHTGHRRLGTQKVGLSKGKKDGAGPDPRAAAIERARPLAAQRGNRGMGQFGRRGRSCHATFLVFLAAAARARVVPSDFRHLAHRMKFQ